MLPPGDWDSKNLISLSEIKDLRKSKKAKEEKEAEAETEKKEEGAKPDAEKGDVPKKEKEPDDGDYDPMKIKYFRGRKFPIPWAGIAGDFRKRAPFYLSDFLDGLNGQTIAATIFIYFAALSGAIAFGGLTGNKSEGLIGIPETLIVSCVAGSLFSLFAGQPMIITGVTGPILLYDEALFGFAKSLDVEFLPWRIWVGVWIVIIALTVSFFQGAVLVRHFTKFTKDIFASLVALLFIFEALRKLSVIFANHPLRSIEYYCNATTTVSMNDTDYDDLGFSPANETSIASEPEVREREPNTALLSMILMFGTFFIGYFLRIFRNGKYLGRTVSS